MYPILGVIGLGIRSHHCQCVALLGVTLYSPHLLRMDVQPRQMTEHGSGVLSDGNTIDFCTGA